MAIDDTQDITIVIPVYNDWDSLNILIRLIDKTLQESGLESVYILIIDDGSNQDHSILQEHVDSLNIVKAINIIHLSCNLGSQRSIAIGLAYVANNIECDSVIVMDSDGEDQPSDILNLLEKYQSAPKKVIVAERSKRSETFLFRFLYKVYKLMFKYLTGKKISFGNFCLIPYAQLKRLVYRSELWINLPATIIRSRLPIEKIPTIRGKRLLGKSSMNFPSLIIHGLSAISVYSDTTLVRILLICLFFSASILSGLILFFSLPIDAFANISQWVYGISFLLLFIFIQSSIIAVFVIFQILSNWAQNPLIPNIHYKNYIWREECYRFSAEKNKA